MNSCVLLYLDNFRLYLISHQIIERRIVIDYTDFEPVNISEVLLRRDLSGQL
jgi:hypothetical protein